MLVSLHATTIWADQGIHHPIAPVVCSYERCGVKLHHLLMALPFTHFMLCAI